VKDHLNLHYADIRDFDLGVKFNLIYFPSFSFDHLLSIEDQVSTLRSIHQSLNPGGLFAFDLAHLPVIKEKSKWFVQQKHLTKRKLVVRIGYQKINP
jgi:SAM-dependent methyltransferase